VEAYGDNNSFNGGFMQMRTSMVGKFNLNRSNHGSVEINSHGGGDDININGARLFEDDKDWLDLILVQIYKSNLYI
jgi:hypothetical protein